MNLSPQVQAFLKQPHFMVLSTMRKDETIQMSVVWYEFRKEKFLVSVTTQRAKYKNIVRNPHVTFVIMNKDNPYQYIQVRGTATISKEGAHEFIDALSQRYTGETPYARDPDHQEDRVIVSITPDAIIPWGF